MDARGRIQPHPERHLFEPTGRRCRRVGRVAKTVLQAETVYADSDFAVLARDGANWILHADHTYDKHPLVGFVSNEEGRGVGAEFRIHELDPDAAEQRARDAGYTVLAGAADKGHGLREAYILDPDGYCWVPDVPVER